MTVHEGVYGKAEQLPKLDRPDAIATVDHWLITAPAYHPFWSQYLAVVVSLAVIPGIPEPKLKHPGMTHEFLLFALDPGKGVFTPDSIVDFTLSHSLPYLTPFNIVEQFTATDEEMIELTGLCMRAIVDGLLSPETADAPTRIRGEWLTSMVRTLAHIRGEEHAK